MRNIVLPALVLFFVGALLFPAGVSLAGLSCTLPDGVEFCLRSPGSGTTEIPINTNLVWDDISLESLEHFVLQIHEAQRAWVDFNVPLKQYCDGDKCSVPALD